MTDEQIEALELIIDMIETYGETRHIGGYKKSEFHNSHDRKDERAYLDSFNEASELLEKIELKIIKSLGYYND
jgi:hypothetical protein